MAWLSLQGGLLDHTYVINTPNIVLSSQQAALQTFTQLTPHNYPVRVIVLAHREGK